MPFYKSPVNEVYYLDSADELHFIPSDVVEITQEEATALTTPAPVPEPPPPPPEPVVVSRFQALAALLQAGLLDDVESFMGLPETDPFMVLAWKEAQDFRRDSPLVISLVPVLGITEAQLDDLFAFAKTITA